MIAASGGGGNDTLIGGPGNDTVIYLSATDGVQINLSLPTDQVIGGDGSVGTDSLNGVENVIGSNFGDTITGDDNDNVIEGGA